ncbi:hypothetical protein [Cupriavidus malaysiensis]|uniref:Uncharacterized protein n=1 Tax=Cupriavidus malaysiensis TaxID=367825 RepID=A0A1D9I9B8_9BURK|nr:hypothetical protein [Cupriavidus malaysiensis]AOZ08638.1 hypothetical protein BKK80_22135 [Cupriavidus malaysiensis]
MTTTYRSLPATRLMHDQQVDALSEGSHHRFGFIGLAATQWHRAATLLIEPGQLRMIAGCDSNLKESTKQWIHERGGAVIDEHNDLMPDFRWV